MEITLSKDEAIFALKNYLRDRGVFTEIENLQVVSYSEGETQITRGPADHVVTIASEFEIRITI